MEMQAGGRLIQNVQGAASVAFRQFQRQLDPLRFTAGQGGCALAEPDITEADIQQRMQFARNDRYRLEEFISLFHRHAQHFGNVLALVLYFQRFAVVALAVADIARHIHVRQEMHFNLDHAVALAGFAAAALDVERETPGVVAALLGHRHGGE